ncbi:MAG TPA: RNA polymerase sigma-70 factor [Bacteroidales bacterium]
MDKTDATIVDDLKQGNEKALQAIYEQYNGKLVAYAKYTIRNPLLAEDFVQDAYCTLWKNREKLTSDQPIQSYLFKVVHNRCVDYIRKIISKTEYTSHAEWRLREIELTQVPFENIIVSEILADEAQIIIQQTIQNLSDQTREIFQLSRNEQLKNSEIAERTGLSVKAIEYHIGKALQQLRTALKDFL